LLMNSFSFALFEKYFCFILISVGCSIPDWFFFFQNFENVVLASTVSDEMFLLLLHCCWFSQYVFLSLVAFKFFNICCAFSNLVIMSMKWYPLGLFWLIFAKNYESLGWWFSQIEKIHV
jgi:hypothetical protein